MFSKVHSTKINTIVSNLLFTPRQPGQLCTGQKKTNHKNKMETNVTKMETIQLCIFICD